MCLNKTIQAWSYSRLSTWQQCPYKAKLLMIDGLKEPSNKFMDRGSNIHKRLEKYMNNKRAREFKDMGPYNNYLRGIKNSKFSDKYLQCTTEMQVAFNKDLKQVDWFAKDAWLRGIFDLYIVEKENKATIIDYKTGKRRDSHVDQANMYAALYLLLRGIDNIDNISFLSVKFLYLDSPYISDILEREYNMMTCDKWLKYFIKLGSEMCSDTTFIKRESALCRWCHFRASNGGPCDRL